MSVQGARAVPVVALVAHDIHDHGGMEHACAELIRRESDKVDFIVVSADLAPDLRPLVRRWVHLPVPPRPFPLKFLLFWFLAGRAIRRLDVDLVHTVGAIVPNRVDIAAVYHCHAGQRIALGGFAPSTMSGLQRLNTSISRRMALLAERVCYRPSRVRALAASNDGLGEELQYHYPNVPVNIVPNGVELELMRPSAAARDAKRAELSVAAGTTVALFLGGDWHRKGLPLILEALSLVDQDLVLWVVGRGDRAQMERVADDLGVLHRIDFIGPVPEVSPFYQAADLFMLASSYETFSIPCFEAAACGLPIIVTEVHGAADLVRDGGGGVLVERTPESVASALGRLARSPELRHQMGNEARRRASVFTWQRSVDSMMELYRDLLAEREVRR
jgi:glycosyltransferase involved in cell wall biosynthesis